MKKSLFLFLMFIISIINCSAINVKVDVGFSPAKGNENYNFKVVNSSGVAVSGVNYSIIRQSLAGKCSNSIRYNVVSTNDWTEVAIEKGMEIWYIESSSVPEGYKPLECQPIIINSSNKNVEILISKENEEWQKKELVGVAYNDFIQDNGYVAGIKYALYLNGNCSGTPYLTGISNDTLPVYYTLPVNVQMSIKPLEYPQEYLSKLSKVYDNFFCDSFKVKEIEEKSGIPITYPVLLYGAPIFGARIGANGELVYVKEGTEGSPNNDNSHNNINFANFFIDGKKISSKIDVFLENDRTYMNIKDLCYYMGCEYQKEKNNIIIKFDLNDEGINKLVKFDSDLNNSILDKIHYVVKHEIGSTSYSTYVDIQNYKTFALKSPTFKAETVDVVSLEKNGELYLPLRFISEALGRYVEYEPASNGDIPNIIISSMGTGEFYQKYSVGVSYNEYNVGDILKSEITSNPISLGTNTIFGYGLISAENRIINKSETIFVPLSSDNNQINDNNSEKNSYDNDILYNDYKLKNNSIKHYEYNTNKNEYFAVISNIEGYPFIKIVELN